MPAAYGGKIVSIDGKDITIAAGKKKSNKTTVIHTTATTSITVDVPAGKALADLQVGQKVSVTPSTGTATQIKATTKHKKRKPPKGGPQSHPIGSPVSPNPQQEGSL